MEKVKNIATIALFALIIFGFLLAMFVIKDEEQSYTERRKLQQFPEISAEAVFSRTFSDKLETYLLDQFPGRDSFRTLKAVTAFDVLRQKDNSGIYLVGDGVYKMEYPLEESQVLIGAEKLNALYEEYMKGMNVYYAVIPDKNYFVAKQNGYPCMDYEKMLELLRKNIKHIHEIKLFDCLTAEDYYRTDPHWRQDKLDRVLERFEKRLGLDLPELASYEAKEFYPFYGAYCGQSALNVKPDTITYLENGTTRSAQLYNYESDSVSGVYTPEKYNGMDAYDLFMRGAAAFQVVTNPNNGSGRELIIFRDSFASSLVPLLLEGYSKITLVDLRYMSSSLLPELISFEDQDVLFLYSTLVFNNSAMLR